MSTTATVNPIDALAQTATSSSTTSTGNANLGKDDFLKLLVTQLQNQDPLNPMDDKEFVAEMAQFTSLEQLTNIAAGIDTLAANSAQEQIFSAVSYMGKSILATGDSVSKSGTNVSKVYYTLTDAAKDVTVNIYDASGNIVQSLDYGAQAAGTYSVSWDGTDYNGSTVADGMYKITMAAVDKNDQSILTDTQVTGEVVGVMRDTGTNYLVLSDGRKVDFLNVKEIVETPATSSDSTTN
jgi:flagellar basal-body rod modification protein FlgD